MNHLAKQFGSIDSEFWKDPCVAFESFQKSESVGLIDSALCSICPVSSEKYIVQSM